MDEGSSLLQKMRNLFADNEGKKKVAEEIIDKIEEGYERGVFGKQEMRMISNVFVYMDTDAKDVMTHRKNIVAIDGATILSEAINIFVEENYSRIPVYEGDIDNVIGTMHLRDALKCYLDESMRDVPIKELKECVRPVRLIPETRRVSKLFDQMLSHKISMVVVIDEYGQTSGIVTVEDIVEEIVGNIQDEYDEEEEKILKQNENTYIVDGMTELDDLEEMLGLKFDEEDYDTLNGYLIHCLDHIPSEEEQCKVQFEGYVFTILSVDNNIIRKVEIHKA